MEPIEQPARTYLFYHNGNWANELINLINNNNSTQTQFARRITVFSENILAIKLWTRCKMQICKYTWNTHKQI